MDCSPGQERAKEIGQEHFGLAQRGGDVLPKIRRRDSTPVQLFCHQILSCALLPLQTPPYFKMLWILTVDRISKWGCSAQTREYAATQGWLSMRGLEWAHTTQSITYTGYTMCQRPSAYRTVFSSCLLEYELSLWPDRNAIRTFFSRCCMSYRCYTGHFKATFNVNTEGYHRG